MIVIKFQIIKNGMEKRESYVHKRYAFRDPRGLKKHNESVRW